MVLVFGGMGVAEHILMFQGASKAKLKYETCNQQYIYSKLYFFRVCAAHFLVTSSMTS